MSKTVKLVDMNCGFQSGYGFKSEDFSEEGIPVIKIGNIQNKRVSVSLSENHLPISMINNRISEFFLENGDVLIAMTGQGSVGRVGKLILQPGEQALMNQRVGKFICDEINLNKEFLFYILTAELYQDYLFSTGTGSGQPNLSPQVILETEIPALTYQEQKAIASVLSSLDDKIDLLHRQNKTLEAMAETLFRQWFVEPVRRGGEADDIREDELGKYVDVVDNRGKTPPNSDVQTEYPLIEANALNGEGRLVNYTAIKKYVTEETFNTWFRDKLKKYDTLITTVGANIGTLAMYVVELGNIAQNIVGLSAKNISPFYIYETLKSMRNEILQMDIGGVQPSIKVPHLLSLTIPIPAKDKERKFDSVIEPLIMKMESNYIQIINLEKLRDTLLPKLMSGEVRVRN